MWMHSIDPVALQLGPVQIHWYGLMYVIGFAAAWWLGNRRAAKPDSGWTEQQVSDFIFWGAMGVVLGGRAGYVLFYNFDFFLTNPLWLFAIWEGGMSFHGGLIGVIITLIIFSRRYQKNLFDMGDFVAPLIPIGLGAGRLGNFIGGELWGRATDQSWGVIFPAAGDGLARHPSQLYQMLLEGVVLFSLLWWFSSRPRPRMAVSGLFLLLYASFRMLVEFVREPDTQLGFVAFDWLTMGQVLSLPMWLAGAFMLLYAYRGIKR
ncbi:prolipoprotein diacylglyceryl transferase [Nitrincola sp. A-D6]|uniref:prolipoprotein diacylglyceryl transferase n=1 Tax=Nitrincola sp. A-D6 TaxID=1545442 RepID=UPI00051FCC4A|nr:prolipoprotein diacylglyceryl transferase [Nitrincola sp. A-D6]KGK40973.1 prolipoprotein diacylglyceryl transferase [Nitrincola sp. A-D6]